MEQMWAAHAARTVREVHTQLTATRPLAYTTVMTVMNTLRRKGWLAREPVGRAYAYTPTLSKDRYTADLMGDAFEASSDRSATLVAFLGRLRPTEAVELREALDEHLSTSEAPPKRRRPRTGGRVQL